MTIDIDLTDSEGSVWDIRSDTVFGMAILDGQNDAFDGGMSLRVDGEVIDPQNISLDGREVNAQAVLINGVAVQRSILV